jgi:hypothetical protein
MAKKSSAKKKPTKREFLGYDIPDNAKISIVGDNPRRKGSGPYQQYELMKRARTVANYVEKGGRRMWLPGAVKRGFARIGR